MRLSTTGFREYDARWRYPDEIDLEGIRSVCLALGTQMARRGVGPGIVVGHDYRSYSAAVKDALTEGLQLAGAHVSDIGMCLSPTAYFAQFHLNSPAVAMVTASHNPNGWTGVKMGFEKPCTHGPDDMAALKRIVLSGDWDMRDGGTMTRVDGVADAYLDSLASDLVLSRRLRIVCATGNGTAGAFAPKLLRRLGVEVIERHCTLDHSFPHYNPNPEAMEMIDDMATVVRETGADLAFGFDGDGDRCGVVDENGAVIFADKLGLVLARDMARRHADARFVVDVKSTGLFAIDPVLRRNGASVEYWKTGHSHMKRRIRDTGALAGFEKSGHAFFAPPVGYGYDCGLRVAVELLRVLQHNANKTLYGLLSELPQSWVSPTMSPACADEIKYQVVQRLSARLEKMCMGRRLLAGRRIRDLQMINGVRVTFTDGAWALVRASSNTPNLVVVCESLKGEDDLKALFRDFDNFIREEEQIGAYDQKLQD